MTTTTKLLSLLWLVCTALTAFSQTDEITVTFDSLSLQCIDDPDNCTAIVTYDFQVTADCTFDQLQVEVFLNIFNDGNLLPISNALSGSYPEYSISGSYPLGEHSYEIVVDDGCGNTQAAVLPFEVVDCAVGTPVCQTGQAMEIPPFDSTGILLTVEDFLAEPGTDCTPPLTYTLNLAGQGNDYASDTLQLTCDDEGTQIVELHVQDGAGNSSFCQTYILVFGHYCESGPGLGLGGHVTTEAGEPVAGVAVAISGQQAGVDITDADGLYFFNNPAVGLDYTFTPSLDEAPLNGVSTLDIILISQHILGVQPLDSPYKRIAADTNGSGQITTLDLIQLRRMILSIENGFDNVDSWRFVEAAYAFPDPANPWAEEFPEVINVNDLSSSFSTEYGFIAIKIGDVSGDALTD